MKTKQSMHFGLFVKPPELYKQIQGRTIKKPLAYLILSTTSLMMF